MVTLEVGSHFELTTLHVPPVAQLALTVTESWTKVSFLRLNVIVPFAIGLGDDPLVLVEMLVPLLSNTSGSVILKLFQLIVILQLLNPKAIKQEGILLDMSPEATLAVTEEDTGPPGPWHVSVYVVLVVRAFVVLDPVASVPTETLLYCPPFKVHAVALAIPLHDSVVF